jgi:peptide/nickel transport system permease protein
MSSTNVVVPAAPGFWARFVDSDVWHSFKTSPVAMISAGVRAALRVLRAVCIADRAAQSVRSGHAGAERFDAAPSWMQGGQSKYLLGTDEQGRDVLSALMYGARISILISGASVALSVLIGVLLGLFAGYAGGAVDSFIMRVCDVMLSFPSILIALLIAGVGRALFPQGHEALAFGVLILAISLPGWVQYARTVRGSTMVERTKEYVQAARVVGVPPLRIMVRHVLPNVLGPVLVLATVHVATAIQIEATLSFLGVGVPPTSPSLGTFISEGNKQLFSGAWWLVIFPGAMLLMIALSINLFGDWLRDALNPRLR